MAVNVVNTSELSNLLEQVQEKKSSLSAKISKAKSDYADDKLFNKSASGSNIGETDLTMDKINAMSYTQIQELLNSTPSDEQINAEMEAAEKELNEYIKEFEQLSKAIEQLQKEISNLQTRLETAQDEKLAAEKLLNLAKTNKE